MTEPLLQQAIDEGMDAPPIYIAWPEEVGPTPQQLVRLQKLKAWRSALGQRLSMDPSLIWGMTSLERLASQPDTLDEELTIPSVRAWQRQEFSASLGAVLATI